MIRGTIIRSWGADGHAWRVQWAGTPAVVAAGSLPVVSGVVDGVRIERTCSLADAGRLDALLAEGTLGDVEAWVRDALAAAL